MREIIDEINKTMDLWQGKQRPGFIRLLSTPSGEKELNQCSLEELEQCLKDVKTGYDSYLQSKEGMKDFKRSIQKYYSNLIS